MDTKNLYTFKKIVELGSFKKAAEYLSYAPSTVSFQIRTLEEELSAKLFLKKGSKIELTEDGKALLPMIENLLYKAEQLCSFNEILPKHRQIVKIGTHESLAAYYLQPLLKHFNTNIPKIDLQFIVNSSQDVCKSLVDGSSDIGLFYNFQKPQEPIHTKELFHCSFALVSSPLLKGMNFISPNQIINTRFIYHEPNSYQEKVVNAYLKEKNIQLETPLEIMSTEAIKQSIKNNLGIAYMPRFTIENELKQGIFTEIENKLPESYISVVYAFNQNRPLTSAMKLFIETLEAYKKVSSTLQPPSPHSWGN